MDFTKLEAALAQARKELDGTGADPTVKAMSQTELMAYVEDQTVAAKADADKGDDASKAEAKKRIEALAAVVSLAAKHDFTKGALNVAVYQAEKTDPPASPPAGEGDPPSAETSKAVATLKGKMDDLIAALSGEGGDGDTPAPPPAADPVDDGHWTEDMTKASDDEPEWGWDKPVAE